MLAVLILMSVMLGLHAAFDTGPQDSPAAVDGPERVRVGLVLIEVAVRDRKDQPILGLSLEDFDLQVDGKRVSRNAIPVFEENCAEAGLSGAPAGTPGQQTPETTSRQLPPTRGTVLYFDFTALSFEARSIALKASRDYLARDHPAQDEFMILGFARGDLTTHQDFSTDRAALNEAITRLLKDRATVDLDLPDEIDQLKDVALRAHGPACLGLAREYALAEQERASRSLDQLERVVMHLKGKRDKLNLVLMSDSMRLEPGAQYMSLCGTTPFMQGFNLGKPLERLIDAAEASGIAIYTVHAGGMVDETAATIRHSGDVSRIMAPAAIIDSARRDLTCRYLLGYSPTTAPDGLRHTIRVKVKRASEARHRPFFMDRIP